MINVFPRESASTWLGLIETTPSLVFDPEICRRQWNELSSALPGVRLHYAVKSNPYPGLLQTVANEGGCFDVASVAEIKMLEQELIHASRMIHTHPIKTETEIEKAVAAGVTTFVVDNVDELWKLIPYRHSIRVMLRLSFIAPDAPIDLSRKFGAPQQDALSILDVANDSGIRVDGLCFHVGSQVATANTHADALGVCLDLCEQIKNEGLPEILRIDIGGGFPAHYIGESVNIDAFCHPIREVLKRVPEHLEILAEPGRVISAPSMALVCKVVGRAKRRDGWWFYLDDGVYGAQSGRLFDGMQYRMSVFTSSDELSPCVFAGPTCDSIDELGRYPEFPILNMNDVIVFHEMGAYTLASATRFNGITPPAVVTRALPELRQGYGHLV
ncbi:MAG: type III PLP-dependent enzyme [Pseudomonadota bacterium]|nr:type III PLP-dependent enzyme [Pseudomonadota bacterium]